MPTASTSNRSEIRSPIIRAYLGRKHRSSPIRRDQPPAPALSAPSIFVGPLSEDQKGPKSGRRNRDKRQPRVPRDTIHMDPREEASCASRMHDGHPLRDLSSPVQGCLLKTVNDIVVSLPAHSNSPPRRLGETSTSSSTAHFRLSSPPCAPTPSVLCSSRNPENRRTFRSRANHRALIFQSLRTVLRPPHSPFHFSSSFPPPPSPRALSPSRIGSVRASGASPPAQYLAHYDHVAQSRAEVPQSGPKLREILVHEKTCARATEGTAKQNYTHAKDEKESAVTTQSRTPFCTVFFSPLFFSPLFFLFFSLLSFGPSRSRFSDPQ